MNFKARTVEAIAEMICGNFQHDESFFVYRSSSYLTRFFRDCDTDFTHDGSTRSAWVASVLREILAEPQENDITPPETFAMVIDVLMDQADATNESNPRENALKKLNIELAREGYEAFYGEDKHCYLRHIGTNTILRKQPNPHRPFSQLEIMRRGQLETYIGNASEDELIENILLPLFRQIGFKRITAAGHSDKSLEYGKDIWMKYTLPTQHVLYFGVQVKKGKLDAAGVSRSQCSNIAEIHNQALMMLGHEIFDPEIGKRVLVDHAFIIAGGEITKSARNWLGNKLDASQRSQIMFMDRSDVLDLYIVTNLPLPTEKSDDLSEEYLPF